GLAHFRLSRAARRRSKKGRFAPRVLSHVKRPDRLAAAAIQTAHPTSAGDGIDAVVPGEEARHHGTSQVRLPAQLPALLAHAVSVLIAAAEINARAVHDGRRKHGVVEVVMPELLSGPAIDAQQRPGRTVRTLVIAAVAQAEENPLGRDTGRAPDGK